jgi:hypothetical protein
MSIIQHTDIGREQLGKKSRLKEIAGLKDSKLKEILFVKPCIMKTAPETQ